MSLAPLLRRLLSAVRRLVTVTQAVLLFAFAISVIMLDRLLTAVRRGVSAPTAVALIVFAVSLLLNSGHPYASDEETMLAAGESLARRVTFELQSDALMNATAGPDGRQFSRYGPLQSVALAPLVLLADLLTAGSSPVAAGLLLRLYAMLLPAAVLGATSGLLTAWAGRLAASRQAAVLTGLAYGLAGLALPYSRTLFAEPSAGLCLTFAAYALLREERGWWAAAGCAAAAALTVKVQAALALPALALYALLVAFQRPAADRRAALIGRLVFGLLGAGLPLVLLAAYNTSAFGRALTSGYGSLDPRSGLSTPWQVGLIGLTVGFGKGLLWYSPLVLVTPLAAVFSRRRQAREVTTALLCLTTHLLLLMQLEFWHGDGSWGPRYLVPCLPLLTLPLALLWDQLRGRVARGGLIALIAVSALAAFAGLSANFNTYLQLRTPEQRYFEPQHSPLIGLPQLLLQRLSDYGLRRAVPPATVLLRSGFSYSEGDRAAGALLPRWSYADAELLITVVPGGAPAELLMQVEDHRPWPLERARFSLLLNDAELPFERSDLQGNQIVWQLRAQLPPDLPANSRLVLRSDTWNPARDTSDNPRDEDLALFVAALSVSQDGQVFTLRESLPVPPAPATRRTRWLWYYDPPNNHLFDHWLWFLSQSGLPLNAWLGHAALYTGLALTALTVGLRGLAAAAPPPTVRD